MACLALATASSRGVGPAGTSSSHWEWTSNEAEGNVSGQVPAGGAPDLPPTTVHIYVRTLPPEPFVPPDPDTPIPLFPDDSIIHPSPIDP